MGWQLIWSADGTAGETHSHHYLNLHHYCYHYLGLLRGLTSYTENRLDIGAHYFRLFALVALHPKPRYSPPPSSLLSFLCILPVASPKESSRARGDSGMVGLSRCVRSRCRRRTSWLGWTTCTKVLSYNLADAIPPDCFPNDICQCTAVYYHKLQCTVIYYPLLHPTVALLINTK